MTFPELSKIAQWKLSLAGLCAVVVIASAAVERWRDTERATGQQELRDSLAVAVIVQRKHDVAAAQADADAAVRAAHDTAASLQRASERFMAGLADLPRVELPPVATTPADSGRDSVQITGDSTHLYLLPHAVASWMLTADRKVAQQDSLLRQAATVINVGVPRLRAAYEAALAKKDTTIARLDALASEYAKQNGALHQQLAAKATPHYATVLGWVAVGVLGYVGYRAVTP